MTACPAVLANRRRCDLTDGHGGRHRWVDITWPTVGARSPRQAALQELAAGRWPGETWREWNDRVVSLVEMAHRPEEPEHVHGAWCHPSADGCPERPGM